MTVSSRHRMGPRSMASLIGVLVIVGSGWIAACDASSTDPARSQEAAITVLLTDFPLEAIASAEVSISRIYLVGGGQSQVDLFLDPDAPHEVDLLELQNGATFDLTGVVPVPEGSYGQLRFVIEDARLTLEDGYTFADGASDRSLTIPSGFVRVLLHGEAGEEDDSGAVVLQGGESEVILVDFNVEDSFLFQGPPENPHGVLFRPVLRQMPAAGVGD